MGFSRLTRSRIPFDQALEKNTESLYPLFVHNIGALLYHPTNQSRTNAVMAAADRRRLDTTKQWDALHIHAYRAPLLLEDIKTRMLLGQKPTLILLKKCHSDLELPIGTMPCPSIGDDNTTSPKDNNLNGSLLALGFDNTSKALTMMTPMSTSNHINRETQSHSAER